MNHFMLPEGSSEAGQCARYGVHAMELLINRCMREGADRFRLEAKVFGGGHVLKTRGGSFSVPARNVEFAFSFLETENIRVITKDTGGFAARELHFFTDTGRVLLRRLRETGCDLDLIEEIGREEIASKVVETPPETDITLF